MENAQLQTPSIHSLRDRYGHLSLTLPSQNADRDGDTFADISAMSRGGSTGDSCGTSETDETLLREPSEGDSEDTPHYSSDESSTSLSSEEGPPGHSSMGKGRNPKCYKCTQCSKSFTRPSSLATHKYSHTGEKPHKCDFPGCGRNFSVLSNLRRHLKTHQKPTSSAQRQLSSEERERNVRDLIRRTSNPSLSASYYPPVDPHSSRYRPYPPYRYGASATPSPSTASLSPESQHAPEPSPVPAANTFIQVQHSLLETRHVMGIPGGINNMMPNTMSVSSAAVTSLIPVTIGDYVQPRYEARSPRSLWENSSDTNANVAHEGGTGSQTFGTSYAAYQYQ
ncbi:hypothetical protein BC938DRAFT_480251 [Jimgerdemannia flammicorona]|uniref:C2H2-type domain-containing protein n=1 Tax=Jimgerdemannia flammicorona TaxID=994334 RepID=A0A433QJ36_9FUNG|nr:hypothetical protein BC938DRAFT_480251 [Jimgerdemannia flammicorona]